MRQTILALLCATLFLTNLNETSAVQPPTLPKVDYQVGRISPVGQGLAIPVTNGGFVMSPKTTVSIAIYELNGRRLLKSKNLSVAALKPNQTRRVIFVPPSPRQRILVRVKVDPGNKVQELNERNNSTASQH